VTIAGGGGGADAVRASATAPAPMMTARTAILIMVSFTSREL
jgi:hypothetical protein